MTRIKTFIDFINEKAVPMDDLVKPEPKIGLIVNKWARNGKPHAVLVLYNFDDEKILGYVEMEKLASHSDNYKIERSAAEKDYGPDCYDFALMFASPDGVRPSWTIKPAAEKVWEYYRDNRTEVKKVEMKKDHDDYVGFYGTDDEHEKEGKDPEVLKLVNTIFYLEQSKDYQKLVERGREFAESHNVDVHKIANASTLRNTYFHDKYYASTH